MKRTKGSNSSTTVSDHDSRGAIHLDCLDQVASEEICGEALDRSGHTLGAETCDQAVRSLIKSEGPVVSVQRLKALLGFKSDESLNRAIERGRLGLSTFRLSEERGLFALSAEVGWFLQQGKPRGTRGLHLAIREKSDMSE